MGKALERHETVRRAFYINGVARLQVDQHIGKGAFFNHNREKLEVVVMRARHHRICAPKDFVRAGRPYAKAGELARSELEAGITRAAKRKELTWHPGAYLGDGLGGVLSSGHSYVVADGPNGGIWSSGTSGRAFPRRKAFSVRDTEVYRVRCSIHPHRAEAL